MHLNDHHHHHHHHHHHTPATHSPATILHSVHSIPNDRLHLDSRFVSGIAVAVRGGVTNTIKVCQTSYEDIAHDYEVDQNRQPIYPDTIMIRTRVFSASEEMAHRVTVTAGMQEVDGKFVVVIDTPKSVLGWLALSAAAIASATSSSLSFAFESDINVEVSVVLPPSLASLISLEIENHAGNVEIGDIGNVVIVDQMRIECRNGSVSSRSVNASNIHITTLSGSIRGNFASSSTFLCKTLSAPIDVQLVSHPLPDTVQVESTSGAIRGMFHATREFAAKTLSGTIDVVVRGGPAAATLSNVSGATKGTFQIKERFTASSVSGNIRVDVEAVNKQACEFKVNTISGLAVMCLHTPFIGQFKLGSFSSHATLLSRHKPSKRHPFVFEVQRPNRKLGYAGHVPSASPLPAAHPIVNLDQWQDELNTAHDEAGAVGQPEGTWAESGVIMEAMSGDVQLVLLGT